jgi:hypothetical protein
MTTRESTDRVESRPEPEPVPLTEKTDSERRPWSYLLRFYKLIVKQWSSELEINNMARPDMNNISFFSFQKSLKQYGILWIRSKCYKAINQFEKFLQNT